MNKPKELKIKNCPFWCGGKIELTKEKQKFASKGNIFDGERWIYKCNNCKKGFTTTDSDTISMNNLKVKKT